MRRTVLMLLVAATAAAVLPMAAEAGSGTKATTNRTSAAPVAARTFNLGGVPCRLIDVPAAARGTGGAPLTGAARAAEDGTEPVGVGTCPGVRPGAKVQTERGLCTLNFLFVTPQGERFIGTAGHCIIGDSAVANNAGEQTWAKGTGPAAKDSAGTRFGEFAYAILQEPKDFALIRLDPGAEASPEMCNYGGPTGINDDISDGAKVLEYFGNGIGIGSAVPARSAVAMGFPNADHVYAAGLALPGDSGSGVITDDGRAVGVLVTTGLHGLGFDENGVDFGTMGITRITPQINRASEVLGLRFTMVTAGK